MNVSIGGTLTHFAAPPVLMVASQWEWTTYHMLTHFGWKSSLAVAVNALAALWMIRGELTARATASSPENRRIESPPLLILVHLLFLAAVVVNAHHPVVFGPVFLFFLGVTAITQEFQDALRLRESLLVAFFLGGLVVLGKLQQWWIAPLLEGANTGPLFIGAALLTAITDNAALTYLGSQVPGTTEAFRYALVAGAVAGGGLTVIANAPNPAGYAILNTSFGTSGISALKLFLAALLPTVVALACLWFLP